MDRDKSHYLSIYIYHLEYIQMIARALARTNEEAEQLLCVKVCTTSTTQQVRDKK